MCGIFGYIGKKDHAAKLVFSGLKFLEYRGYDSWGVAIVTTKEIVFKKRIGKIGKANVNDLPLGSLAIGHTRWATHGGVTQANAHPHLDCQGKIAVIHNGIFENYEQHKQQLSKLNHRFVSETDTEVISHLIEEYRKKFSLEKSAQLTFQQMQGLNAFVVISSQEPKIVAVRNGSPLVIGFGKGENFLASDAAALLPYTREVYFLEDQEMAIIEEHKIRIKNALTDKVITPNKQILNWKVAQAQKGKYPHFMLKEIYEQPEIIKKLSSLEVSSLDKIADLIKRAHGTYLIGCGTAYHACLTGNYLFSKIAKRHINTAVASEFGYQLDFINDQSFVLALSQSGETIDILESVKKAKEHGAKTASLVNVQGSSLYRLTDEQILLNAGPEKAVASTKAFTAKLGHLLLLAYSCRGQIDQGRKILTLAQKSVQQIFAKEVKKIQELATKIKPWQHMYVVGRGLSYPVSLETALKIKEVSYLHAEGFAAGELKHGVIALIEKGTPSLVFAPDDESYGANLAGAMELKARGGYIIGVSHKPHEVFDYFLKVEDAREATIIPNAIVGQLLAYYLSVVKGLDPDMPRNLAKSVTVK